MTAHTDVICQPGIEPSRIDDGSGIGARFYLAAMLGYVKAPGSVAILATDRQILKRRISIGSQSWTRRQRKHAVADQASRKGRSIERQIGHLETGRQLPRACL